MQGDWTSLKASLPPTDLAAILENLSESPHYPQDRVDDAVTTAIFRQSDAINAQVVREVHGLHYQRLKAGLDTLLIGKWTGIPIMALLFGIVIWLTVIGTNVPSGMLANLLVDQGHPWLRQLASGWLPEWMIGLCIDGMYLTCAWVVAVMLPPMAIFFPLFTLLEDFGYLPRVAFNLDGLFKKAGAHGKQALTMAMGYGCNAAGVIAARIIESPRERLIAILTNNFSLCNGRWPTQILMGTLFLGSMVSARHSSLAATLAVSAVAALGVALTFFSSWLLSRTLLKGTPSSFSLELPPYRAPRLWATLYKSLIDRTLFVLWRAVVFALPAGAVIWLLAQINLSGQPLALDLVDALDPLAAVMGLTGVILLAYVVAIPANEIVIPTILMLTVMQTGIVIEGASGAGILFESDNAHHLLQLLQAGGWTPLTAVCLMLFSLAHNPCSTTIFTIYRETRSIRWTAVATLMPLAFGFILCTFVAQIFG
jgi:ferrous iron transport protein B